MKFFRYFKFLISIGLFLFGVLFTTNKVFAHEITHESYLQEEVNFLLDVLNSQKEKFWDQSILDFEVDYEFCQKWNPAKINQEVFDKHGCCYLPKSSYRIKRGTKKKRTNSSLQRSVASRYQNACDAITDEQKEYIEAVKSGEISDVLQELLVDIALQNEQAFCGVNNGFLANGRPLVETPHNRVQILRPEKCTYFGTDSLVALVEWLGRSINEEFPNQNIKLRVGDLSAPRGGVIFSPKGHKSHRSHTNGLDVDFGFLSEVNDEGARFQLGFDLDLNWWLLKKIFKNPIVCVQAVFLDRSIINKLKKKYSLQGEVKDPEWDLFSGYLKHVSGHKNHMHLRVGPGLAAGKNEKGKTFQCQSIDDLPEEWPSEYSKDSSSLSEEELIDEK